MSAHVEKWLILKWGTILVTFYKSCLKKKKIIFLSEKNKNTTHTHKLKFNQSIPNNTACDNTYNKHKEIQEI